MFQVDSHVSKCTLMHPHIPSALQRSQCTLMHASALSFILVHSLVPSGLSCILVHSHVPSGLSCILVHSHGPSELPRSKCTPMIHPSALSWPMIHWLWGCTKSLIMVWCPDPTLSRGKGLVTIECFLGCAKSIVLIFEQADEYSFILCSAISLAS